MGKKKNKSASTQNTAQTPDAAQNGASTPASVASAADQPDISAVDIALDPDAQSDGVAAADSVEGVVDSIPQETGKEKEGSGKTEDEGDATDQPDAGPSARRATAELAAMDDVQQAAEQKIIPVAPSEASREDDAARVADAPNGSHGRVENNNPRSDDSHQTDGDDRIRDLEDELARVRDEKDALDGQYRGLLGKLTTMRKSLGDKLREDAEELDRRENTITALSAQIENLEQSLSTLRDELANANAESSSLASQLSAVRSQSDSSSSDVLSLTREMRELRGEMERLRMEREEWEGEASRERERREGMESEVNRAERREREMVAEVKRAKEDMQRERERADNLQDVLQEFQTSKESELRSATVDLEKQLQQAATSLSEFKLRCANAETQLSEVSGNASRYAKLEKDIKDKEKLVSKLRHDAVVNNEHLTEALRRLRKSSSDSNVDRRLVTNILLAFLGAKRGDSKRFEMLNILATILSWDDVEREKAGLQRNGTGSGSGATGERPKVGRKGSEVEGRSAEEEAAMNESFSDLFVEFLLKEASQGQPRSKPHPHADSSSSSSSNILSPRSPGLVPLPPFSPTGTGTGASTPAFRGRTYSQTSMSSVSASAPQSLAGAYGQYSQQQYHQGYGSGILSPTGEQPPTPGVPGLPTTGRKESWNLRTALTGQGGQGVHGYGGDRTPTPTDR